MMAPSVAGPVLILFFEKEERNELSERQDFIERQDLIERDDFIEWTEAGRGGSLASSGLRSLPQQVHFLSPSTVMMEGGLMLKAMLRRLALLLSSVTGADGENSGNEEFGAGIDANCGGFDANGAGRPRFAAEDEACADCRPMPCNDGKVKLVCDARFSAGVGLGSAHETRFFLFSASVAVLLETKLTDSVLEGIVTRRRAASAESPSIGDIDETAEGLVTLLVRQCLHFPSLCFVDDIEFMELVLGGPVSRWRALFISSADGTLGMFANVVIPGDLTLSPV